MPTEIDGARVLVLGGSGVLGGQIAIELHRRGATVMLAGRDRERLRRKAEALGPEVLTVVVDLISEPERVVDACVEALGGMDGLVNAAGVVAFGSLSETSDAVLDELAEVDLIAPLRIIRAAIPHLDDGFIVNLTGVVAEQPMAQLVAYSAVKAGLSAATRALARELRKDRIHVLDARPPHTETGLASRPINGTAPRMPQGLEPRHVARRIIDGLVAGEREIAAEQFAVS